MKLYIATDMEGISGTVHGTSTMPPSPDYDRYRKLMTQEVNAAIEGALEAGVTEILVNDGHGTMRNILAEELHPEARLISGYPKPMLQLTELDTSFSAAVFIGFHARSNTNGVMSHTFFGSGFNYLKLNGHECTEAEFDAAVAGRWNVPVVCVSGDNILEQQLKAWMPSTRFAQTKIATSHKSANSLHPTKACAVIKEQVMNGIRSRDQIPPLKIAGPYEIEVQFKAVAQCDVCSIIPGVTRIDPITVRYSHSDLLTVSNMMTTFFNVCAILLLPFYQ